MRVFKHATAAMAAAGLAGGLPIVGASGADAPTTAAGPKAFLDNFETVNTRRAVTFSP